MTIKEFYGKDTYQFRKLCAQLFHKKLERGFDEALENCDKDKTPDFTRLGAYDGDCLLGALEIIPYVIRFDGHDIKMGGIGGVVSAHEARGRGVIKSIFSKAFEVMREKGQYISHLYPFKGDYYRLYGYEVTCDSIKWKIPSEYLRPGKKGSIRGYDGSLEMQKDIMSVYDSFCQGKNFCILKDWDKFFKNVEPGYTESFAYVHYTDGVADGHLVYTFNRRSDERPFVDVPVFWYKNRKGIEGLLGFLAGFKDYADFVSILCPADLGPFIEFNGGWGQRDTERQIAFCGSTRVIDAERILELADFDGRACVRIKDELCPWNDDVFTVENGCVTRGGEPDCECEIGAFSMLISGRCEDVRLAPGIEIYKNEDSVSRLFCKKELWFDEHY